MQETTRPEPLQIDWLNNIYTTPGRLGLSQLPGRADHGRSLPADLAHLKAKQISHIIALVSDAELPIYGVEGLFEAYQQAGFEVYRLPIPDYGISSLQEMTALTTWLERQLAAGAIILLHCVGGLGRSGMAAACYLRSTGLSHQAAIREVRRARSPDAIETQEQMNFVHDFITNGTPRRHRT